MHINDLGLRDIHRQPPPMNRITHLCENITFLTMQLVIKILYYLMGKDRMSSIGHAP